MQTSNGLRFVKEQLNDVFAVNKDSAITSEISSLLNLVSEENANIKSSATSNSFAISST